MQTVFKFNIQSFSDIITNSSSELFVFKLLAAEHLVELLNEIYPNWREEYEYPIVFKDMSKDLQIEFINWVAYPNLWFLNYKHYFNGVDWITRSEQDAIEEYEKAIVNFFKRKFDIPEEEVPNLFDNWHTFCNGEYNSYLEFSFKAYDLFSKKFENDVCLWSIDENPNWDYQEKIMEIGGKRYHLG